MPPVLKLIFVSVLAVLWAQPTATASLIYLYDFPGGSGLASDQTNPQPGNATFSDFTRNNVGVSPSNPGNTFASNDWSTNGSIDTSKYEGFSITAAGGFHLNLSSLSFDLYRSATGPANMEVGLFLNGSATAYATYDFSPTMSTTTYTFNFTPLTDSSNVTSATFNFYGWNAVGVGGQVYVTNVGTYGDISNVPEASTLVPILFLFACVFVEKKRRKSFRARPRAV
jgi:hypothetical protein